MQLIQVEFGFVDQLLEGCNSKLWFSVEDRKFIYPDLEPMFKLLELGTQPPTLIMQVLLGHLIKNLNMLDKTILENFFANFNRSLVNVILTVGREVPKLTVGSSS